MIKKLREREGLTQAQLAKKAGVTEAYVSMIESGGRRNPSLPILKKLGRALGVPVGDSWNDGSAVATLAVRGLRRLNDGADGVGEGCVGGCSGLSELRPGAPPSL
jgi:transcriptional regulator with XRE-family HTH domain